MVLTLIRGLPGSGKSTLAKWMLWDNEDFGTVHLEADMFHVRPDGVYDWKPENVGTAHKWCQDSTRIFLSSGYDVIVSNTFTRLKEMEFYLNLRNVFPNLKIDVYRCMGNWGNVHNVPEASLLAMKNRFENYPGETLYYGSVKKVAA